MLGGVPLSAANYSALLNDLATSNTNTGVVFGAGLNTYDDSAVIARLTTLSGRTWTITDGGHTKPVITSATAINATVSTTLSYQITTTSANAPTSFGAAGLPAGLSINATTGLITGTTSASPAITTITISAINAGGTTNATLTLSVGESYAPVISSSTAATGIIFQPFTYTIVASGNPISYTAVGLPAGLVIDPWHGIIQGTPTTTGSSAITISATNLGGTGVATLSLIIKVPAASEGDGSTTGGSSTGGGGGGGCGIGGTAALLLGSLSLFSLRRPSQTRGLGDQHRGHRAQKLSRKASRL
ncbi:MAG TPA: hypothetical protein DCS97_03995 [Planctomycetes bacterium]|nr:hypothetical protein [Planctomycetota bacterium]